MIRFIVFNVLLSAVVVYAAWRGGKPERWTAAMIAAGAAATYCVSTIGIFRYVEVEWRHATVDAVLMIGLLVIVARADRFWPIYAAAFHVVALASHGVRAIDATILPGIYYRVTAWSAYPILIILALGTFRHRRRLLAGCKEFSWTTDRHAERRRPD